jgi:flavodoxin
MNALVVYYSRFGNTEKIAAAIAETLKSEGPVRLVGSDDLVTSDLKDADLVVIGSPTYRMNVPEEVRAVLEPLPRRLLRGVPVAAFDTSYKMSALLARFTAARKLARKLRQLGGRQVVLPETFHVVGREGPLYEGEIGRAKAWAESIRGEMATSQIEGAIAPSGRGENERTTNQ